MKTFVRLVTPSVLSVFVILSILVSCKQASNFESGDKITAMQLPNVEMATPPPPPPSENDKLAKMDGVKRLKLEDGNESQAPTKDETKPQKEEITERKVIKTGDIRFKTNDLHKTRQAIVGTVNALNGYVGEESQTGDGTAPEMRMTLRIPAQYFDSLLTIISSNADYFDSKNIRTQDVTEEFIDVMARIKTKKSLENQYATILKQAQTIKEIMEVERELNSVREEIESAEGRMRYLSSQVSYSTLTLVFYKETLGRVGTSRSFWSRLGDGLVNGWQNLLDVIVGLASAWSFLLILGGIIWGIRWILKIRNKRKATSAHQGPSDL